MQPEDEDKDLKMNSSSFRVVIDSPTRIPPHAAADLQIKEGSHRKVADIATEDDDDDDDFSFVRIPQNPNPLSSADEIFSQGKIRPVYPLFGRHILIDNNSRRSLFSPAVTPAPKVADPKPIRGPLRRLFIEEERDHGSSSLSSSSSSSSSSLDELDGIPPGTYCVWTPKKEPDRCTKSRSSGSGSSSLRWRLRDLVSGRSRSDGKEKFVFINPMMERRQQQEEGEKDKEKTKTTRETDELTVQKRLEYCGGQSGQELEALKTAG